MKFFRYIQLAPPGSSSLYDQDDPDCKVSSVDLEEIWERSVFIDQDQAELRTW